MDTPYPSPQYFFFKIFYEFLVWDLELNTSDHVKFYLSSILLKDENVYVFPLEYTLSVKKKSVKSD